jgi:hypothetical protein
MTKPSEKINKEYPKYGPFSQFRFEKPLSFDCFKCGHSKTSKLLAIYNSDWSQKLCNACYGEMLSEFNKKD